MTSATCNWPVDRSCFPPLPELPDTPTPEQQAEYDKAVADQDIAADMAVSVLWALSGRQFGACPVIARPCPPASGLDGWAQMAPGVLAWTGDNWVNLTCGCFGGKCQLSGPRMLHLPGPVAEIVKVRIGGHELDPAEYTLQGGVLYRIGGVWPSQDLSRPLPEDGTWSVEYLRGSPVPPGVGKLAGLLAQEFLAACSGGKCRLPRNVTAVTRNGVSYQVYDPNSIFASGKTGLAEVDLWLSAVNPYHVESQPRVL